jgi:hypothetical protein
MTLYKENGELYEVIKVGGIPGQPLEFINEPVASTNNNKTSGGLGNGEIWNDGSTGDDVSSYGTITVCIYSDNDSAADGLKFEASFDQSTWYVMESYTYKTAAGLQVYSMAPGAKYFRTRFINGVIPTTVTRIETSYRQCYTKPSSHRISDNITGEKDAELVKAVLAAMKPDTTFTDIHCTAGGNLKVSVEEVNGIDPLPTRVPARTPTTTSISGSASSVTLVSGNANRAGLTIHNLSSANLLVSFTSPATSGNCFTQMTSGQFLKFDQQLITSGAIYGIWDSAVGTAQVTEYV